MKVRESLIVALVITFTGSLLTIGNNLTNANDDPIEPLVLCNPAGSYYAIHPAEGFGATVTIIANDPACNSISCIQKIFNMNHTLGGMFPEAVAASDMIGNGIRTGPNTWRVTIIRYVTDGAVKVIYMAVITGDFTFSDDASVLERNGTWALYLPEQDKDGDGWPDDDETPMLCVPDEGQMPRMKILPMQEPMPLPTPDQ
jgi:hypothetical protein